MNWIRAICKDVATEAMSFTGRWSSHMIKYNICKAALIIFVQVNKITWRVQVRAKHLPEGKWNSTDCFYYGLIVGSYNCIRNLLEVCGDNAV